MYRLTPEQIAKFKHGRKFYINHLYEPLDINEALDTIEQGLIPCEFRLNDFGEPFVVALGTPQTPFFQEDWQHYIFYKCKKDYYRELVELLGAKAQQIRKKYNI